MKKEQDNNLIDYNKMYNEIQHKVMKQLNEKQNNQNLNALLEPLLEPEMKNEVKKINQKCEYCLFKDVNITLTENDVNKYFLMKITGKTKVAKLCEFNISKNEFAFVLSDGVVYFTDEKGKTTWNDIFVVQKLEHFPNIDLTENTKYGDIFITKNGHKLKYVYKLSALNNIEFIYVFTDDNKMYNFNRYGEYEAYNNGNNLYVKYEENNNNNTNNVLDIAPDIIKQINDQANDNLNDLMKQLYEKTQTLDNKQNTDINLNNNNNYNKKYNNTQYMNYTIIDKFFYELAKEMVGENATQQQLNDCVIELKNRFEKFKQQVKNKEKQEFEPYKEEARKICSEKNIEITDDELETFAALFCAKNSKELPMDLTTYQQQTNHINELIDTLDNEYKGNINDVVEDSKYNTNTEISKTNTDYNFVDNFPLKIDSIYINEKDLNIIYVKSISPSKIIKEIEILTDTYVFNNEEYVLYKNEYYTYDLSDLAKYYTIEELKFYKEISKEDVDIVINHVKIMQDKIKRLQENIKEIKKEFKNLLKNLIFINKNY